MDTKEEKSPVVETKEDPDEGRYRIYSSLAFMTVVIVIGVPMWWKTTEVYRVPLPDTAIKKLQDIPIEISTVIRIYTQNPETSQNMVKELTETFANTENWAVHFESVTGIDSSKMSTPAALEAAVLRKNKIKEGDFLFLEWHKLKEDLLLTSDRTALFRSSVVKSHLADIIKCQILQMHRIKSTLDDVNRLDHKSKRTPVQPEYDIIVSVLNPRPDIMDINWNVRLAAEMYIQPFLDRISLTSNYTLKTQWRYEAHFVNNLKQVKDDSKIGRHFAVEEKTFPHMITAIEKKLGNSISDKPCIHLIVYVPSCDISPLRVYKPDGRKASEDKIESFISPNWGSVVIYNPPVDLCLKYNEDQQKISFSIVSKDVMQILLFHIGKLLDIPSDYFDNTITVTDVEQLGPRLWEYDAFVRRSAVSHIMTVTHTLQSLIQLLDDINYILINDDVGRAINQAHESVVKAKEYLANNELVKASEYAKRAYISSERAFFDASLLEQLYFPDEQKYAVYIPLFLPIMVPVVCSLAVIKKFFTASSKDKIKTS